MGRALYSQSYAPAIREPSPSPYEKWGINNNIFDPDSEEFFSDAQYEAFLPTPTNDTNDVSSSPPRTYISTTRTTATPEGNLVVRPSRVRISSEDPTSIIPTAHSDAAPPTSSPPLLPDLSADVDSSRPAPSPMAADSDSEDPMRILAGFMNSTAEGEGEAQLNVSDILRHLDEQWRRELRESQTQEDGDRPHRYLPPLSYPSSSSSLSSSRSDSPSSPMFFPSPPSDARPLPPQMTRQYAQSGTFLPAAEPSDDLAFHFDEELAQVERVDLIRRLERTESLSAPLSDPVPIPTESSIPISQTPPRAIHRTPNSLGYDVGLDMSPPPSVSPRLYNWSRSRSESHLRRDPVSASPTRFLGRSGSVRGTMIPITERSF